MSDDKPRIQWSATEIVGNGIVNPERVRKTEDGKTVLMPTNDYPVGVISELTPSNREAGGAGGRGMTRTLRCRYTGQKITGNFVRGDDADIDWDDNECSVCGASGYGECTTETGDVLGAWIHAAREVPVDEHRSPMFPIDHGGVLVAAAKAAGFVEIASTPAINHDEIKKRRFASLDNVRGEE